MGGKRWILLLGCLLGGSVGCGLNACGQTEDKVTAGAPQITHMEFTGALQDDPWMLIFAVDFAGAQNGLGDGKGLFYTSAAGQPHTIGLTERLQSNGVAVDASEGRLGINLGFEPTLSDGQTVRLGTLLRDANNRQSNCFALDLRFDVTPLP